MHSRHVIASLENLYIKKSIMQRTDLKTHGQPHVNTTISIRELEQYKIVNITLFVENYIKHREWRKQFVRMCIHPKISATVWASHIET